MIPNTKITNVVQTPESLSKHIHKVFLNTKVGDKIIYLNFDETGGIYEVIDRKGIRGVKGTITLILQKFDKTNFELDLRSNGDNIAMIGLIRSRKPRSASK